MATVIGKVRSTRKNQRLMVESTEIGGLGKDGRHWYSIATDDNGVVSCSCPAWKFQKAPIMVRQCKHTMKFAENFRMGNQTNNDVIVIGA